MDKQYISITELAKKFDVNKSLFFFYIRKGLIKPVETFGKMYLFDRKSIMRTIRSILRYKKNGLSLQEIKNKISIK